MSCDHTGACRQLLYIPYMSPHSCTSYLVPSCSSVGGVPSLLPPPPPLPFSTTISLLPSLASREVCTTLGLLPTPSGALGCLCTAGLLLLPSFSASLGDRDPSREKAPLSLFKPRALENERERGRFFSSSSTAAVAARGDAAGEGAYESGSSLCISSGRVASSPNALPTASRTYLWGNCGGMCSKVHVLFTHYAYCLITQYS